MRIHPSLAFATSLLLGHFTHGVLSAPKPDPKAAWVRQGRTRKGLTRGWKRWENDTAAVSTPACVDSNYTQISAPKDNVWGGLTDVEAASVTQWLFAQSELNLTVSDEAGEWDNTV